MISVMYNGKYLTDKTQNDVFNPDFEEDSFAAQNSFHINIESDKTIEEFKADLLNNSFANEWSNGNYKVLDAARSYCAKLAGRVAVRIDELRPYWGTEKAWDEEDVSQTGWVIRVRDIARTINHYLGHVNNALRKLEGNTDEDREFSHLVDFTNFRMVNYDYKELFDKFSNPDKGLNGLIVDLDNLNSYKKSRPYLHITEDGHYKIPLTAKGKELYRAGIALGIVDFVRESALTHPAKNEWTFIYEQRKELFDKILKDAGITEYNEDSIRNKVINFKAYYIKDYKGVVKNIKKFKSNILSEVFGIGRLAKKLMTEEGVKHYGKQEIDRLNELTKIEEDFYNEDRTPKSEFQLTISDLQALSKMNKIERDLLLNSGFHSDDLIMIVRYMLPETNGIPRFTADYNNYLHTLRGFNYRGCNSNYYPGRWEMEAYKYPLVRELCSKETEYLAADVGHIDPPIIEQMLEDGIKINQIKVITNKWEHTFIDFHRKLTEQEKELLYDSKTLTNNIVSKIRHNMYLYKTNQQDKMEDISAALLEEIKTNKTLEPYKSTKNNEVEKMFKDKYHFIPKCVPQIKNMVDCEYMTAAEAVNNFDRKKIQDFAELSNPAMIRLTYELDTNALTDRQKQVLECYATPQNIDALVELKDLWKDNSKNWRTEDFAGFVEAANYINQNENIKGLINDANKKFGQVREEIKRTIEYQRAEQDIRNYEEDYEYSFKDNTNEDIRGRKISVTSVDGRDLTARILAPDDPLLFTKGYKTYSCDHYDGAGESCVYAQTSGDFPNAGGFVIEEKGRLVAQAYVWVDNKHDTFVFDNIEFANDRDTRQYTDILQEYVQALPYKNVHMGRGYNENMANSIESRASEIIDCNLKKNEEVWSPSYYMEDGEKEYIYTDYSSSAVVLKRDGEMTFSAEHPERYEVQNNIAVESPDKAEEQADISAIDYLHETPDDTIDRIMKQRNEKADDGGLDGRNDNMNRASDEPVKA